MTYVKDVFGRDLQLFDKFFDGFDDQRKNLSKLRNDMTKNLSNYPPYNIIRSSDNCYIIEIAVAGFSKTELTITRDDNKLIVNGTAAQSDVKLEYMHKGIGSRVFTREFILNDYIEVKGASMADGILKIVLENIVPDHKKAKTIEISDPIVHEQKTKQFLVEDPTL